ncbi:hypothetical protein [Streptomyces sp. NPDC017673]|uniref:hypothetical protein n=1 Tax=unclassified Streptomyces TaxID=2593676 RepID=UPI003793CC5C
MPQRTGGGEQTGKDGVVSRSVAARTPSGGPEFIGFMQLLDSVAEPQPQAPATVVPEPSEPPEPGRVRTAPTPLPTPPPPRPSRTPPAPP